MNLDVTGSRLGTPSRKNSTESMIWRRLVLKRERIDIIWHGKKNMNVPRQQSLLSAERRWKALGKEEERRIYRGAMEEKNAKEQQLALLGIMAEETEAAYQTARSECGRAGGARRRMGGRTARRGGDFWKAGRPTGQRAAGREDEPPHAREQSTEIRRRVQFGCCVLAFHYFILWHYWLAKKELYFISVAQEK